MMIPQSSPLYVKYNGDVAVIVGWSGFPKFTERTPETVPGPYLVPYIVGLGVTRVAQPVPEIEKMSPIFNSYTDAEEYTG